jgi:hypothetical protein
MPHWLPSVALVAGVLVICQVLLGAAFTGGSSIISRKVDGAAFWGTILNQCVTLTVTIVAAVGLSTVDWAKIAKATGPRRGG